MRILLVDDDRDSRAAVRWFLKDRDFDVVECTNGEQALAQLASADYLMVLSDINMPGMSGIELAKAAKQLPNSWRTDFVLFTGYADIQSAVEALRLGVYDYLQKPVDAQELISVIDRVAEHQALLRENKTLTERFQDEVRAATEEARNELSKVKKVLAESVIGKVEIFGEVMRSVFEQAQKYHSDRTISVLIQGETGVGKEIVARTIHYGMALDALSGGAFVDINCAAIAPSLFESELFGYEAGAFSGGVSKGAKGKFDLAQGGTLFLDEVGEIPLELQGKLLRVLQEKEYYRVGGLKKIKTDARIICATNVPLEERISQGTFRRDLYYRLKVGHLVVPPLRDRRAEIVPLALTFLVAASRQKGKHFANILPSAAKVLEEYGWPGNVRELKNVIEFAAFAYDDTELKPEYLDSLPQAGQKDLSTSLPSSGSQAGRQLILPFPIGGYPFKKYCNDIITEVLAAHGGNQTATARYLKMTLRALAYRLEKQRSTGKKSAK